MKEDDGNSLPRLVAPEPDAGAFHHEFGHDLPEQPERLAGLHRERHATDGHNFLEADGEIVDEDRRAVGGRRGRRN
ncbi:MAG TPA: hypothetical protein VMG37_08005 [Solirubrobacteraceae bacterium]|nr:hypothetical protein [Solirubrobacteraceae bacterium]